MSAALTVMPGQRIGYVVGAGASLEAACRGLCVAAEMTNCEVWADFNGHKILARPGDKDSELLAVAWGRVMGADQFIAIKRS